MTMAIDRDIFKKRGRRKAPTTRQPWQGETFEPRAISIRAGLTPAEASAVHSAMCETGDMGQPSISRFQQERETTARVATSNDAPKALRRLVKHERVPAQRSREERWAAQDSELRLMWQTVEVSHDAPIAYPAGHVYAPERGLGEPWEKKSRDRAARIRQAWLALRRISGESLSVLWLLYGYLPPNMPPPGSFAPAVDADYRRVVRLLPGGSIVELMARTKVDRSASDSAAAGRDVAEYMREMARKCEALIRRAVGEYRAAVAKGGEDDS